MKGVKVIFLTTLFILILSATYLHGQSVEEQRGIFTEAESHYLFGEYELANPLYLILNEFMPNNANLRFKIGDCYLNIPDERSKAIAFLEDAVREVSTDAKPEIFRETRAPIEAWFSLATAYRINNELDKAINTYQTYLKLLAESGVDANTDFVNQQIAACRNAVRVMEEPVEIEKINLGPIINQGAVNFNPVLSFDGNSMVFAESRGLENAIFYTIKERGIWQTPMEITSQLGDAKDCHPTGLNADGTELYLYKNDNFDGNIYKSTLNDGSWSKIKSLNRNINTRYYEAHASISHDGTKLYFSSNRPGSLGELDIYVSTRSDGGDWGVPVNLGPSVNTPFNDNTPFVTANDSLLFFSSEGHSSIGGYDIYKSEKVGDGWKNPDNLGHPLNTTDDDLFFIPFNNGNSGYYSLYTGYKNREIFMCNIGGITSEEEFFEIKGIYSLEDTVLRFDNNYQIYLINLIKGDTLDVAFPNEFSGLYTFLAKPGTFRIVYSGLGYVSETVDTTITKYHPTTTIDLNVELKPDSLYIVDKPAEPEIVYEKIDLSAIPTVASIDTSILLMNMIVRDIGDTNSDDSEILYFTVQVMALRNPVDVSYFKHINDMVVMYNDLDQFYRYTTGKFDTREEAYSYRLQLIGKGYPDEIFIKKVFRE
ncbi:MAG: PD40 domain-containing protein [Bacteroidales bacterium]|nr:PD40 domain-containing protein [Bacteroidales bacterium]